MNKTNSSLLPTLLLVLFIGLKLGGVINWSWWWVLSPLWIPLAILGVSMTVLGVVVCVKMSRSSSNENRN